MREEANKFYEGILKKLKINLGETYSCNFAIKNMLGENINIDCFSFEILNDSFDLSPMLNCSFLEKGNIYFAEPSLILDKYDKNGIIESLEDLKLSNTYNVNLLKNFLKIIKEEKK